MLTQLCTVGPQVLGTEIKGNNAKFTRWMTQTILAGADEMKLGFVTRSNMASSDAHVVLATHVRVLHTCVGGGREVLSHARVVTLERN